MTTLLLQADPGRSSEVVDHVSSLPAVAEAVLTSGPYDVIAHVAPDADVASTLASVKKAPGLSRVCVCRSA